jgi:homoserine dehydrogenase
MSRASQRKAGPGELGIALVGCGTVGAATATILTRDAADLAASISPKLSLRYIVDVDFTRARQAGLDEKLFCDDLDKALADPAVGAVVELIGGTTIARDVITKALKAGKHVVTANKALLAHHGAELWAIARENGVCIAFEASCAGGIPIIRTICNGLIANRIDALYGIVNGTCNYILTAMTERGQTYAEALRQAQTAGLAEADPTLDVAGIDSAHKLAIMAGLAFRKRIDFGAIPVQGIDTLQLQEVQYAQEVGYVVKLLAIAERQADSNGREGISLRVRPAFIPRSHPLARVSGEFNAISVFGHNTGHTMYYGRGAGGMPTGSAVVADLASVAMGITQRTFELLNIWPDRCEAANQLPAGDICGRYYIRLTCEDRPGVLATMAAVLGKHGIGISSVLQHEPSPTGRQQPSAVPVVITTHRAKEANIRGALEEVNAMDVTKAPSVLLDIVEEYPEPLE